MLIGRCPFFVFLVLGPPPLPCLHAVCEVCTLTFRGVPPLLRHQAACGGCACPTPVAPPPPWPVGGLRVLWGPPPPPPPPPLAPGLALGAPAAVSGVNDWSLAARHGHVLLSGGSPHSFPPLAAAHVKCARLFRGFLFLVINSSHAARWERALPGSVVLLCLPPGLVGRPSCGLMAVPGHLVPHVSWIDHRPRQRQ